MKKIVLIAIMIIIVSGRQSTAKDIKNKIEKLVGECQGGKQKSCQKLADMAREATPDVRAIVVDRLTDQSVLAEVAKAEQVWQIREAAVGKLEDRALLMNIARKDTHERVRLAALRKLTRYLVVTGIATEEGEPARLAAVERFAGIELLAEIAEKDMHSDVRKDATSRLLLNIAAIHDPSELANIAKKSAYESGRVAALRSPNLTDQAFFEEIAEHDKEWTVRRVALERLTDQAQLARFAAVAKDAGSLRAAALLRIRDEALLANVAKKMPALAVADFICGPEIELTVLALDGETVAMGTIFLTPMGRNETRMKVLGPYVGLRSPDGSFSKFTDIGGTITLEFLPESRVQPITIKLNIYDDIDVESVVDDGDQTVVVVCYGASGVRYKGKVMTSLGELAIQRVANQALLADIAKSAENMHMRVFAAARLQDGTLLAQIAKGDADQNVRREAVLALKNQALLAQIAKNDREEPVVRLAAVKKLTDQRLLEQIAKDDDLILIVRIDAIQKLTNQALLTDFAKNDEDSWVRRTAEQRLMDLQK